MFTRARGNLFPWKVAVVFFLGWALLTLYPRPSDFARSLYHVFRPPVDAVTVAAYAHLFADLDDPAAIERRVGELFPYSYDWVAHNRPWYFPTLDEAFLVMTGDCKTQLLVLASILEYRGVPYRLAASPTHVWVEYPGKRETRGENARVAFFSADPETGVRRWKLPAAIDVRRSLDSFWSAFWRYMPPFRKLMLGTGLVLSVLLGIALRIVTSVPADVPSGVPAGGTVGAPSGGRSFRRCVQVSACLKALPLPVYVTKKR